MPEQREFRVFPMLTILAGTEAEAEAILRQAQAALDAIEGIGGPLDEECYREVDGDIDVPWEPDSMEGGDATSELARLRAENAQLRRALGALAAAVGARYGGTHRGERMSWHFEGAAVDEVLNAEEAARAAIAEQL